MADQTSSKKPPLHEVLMNQIDDQFRLVTEHNPSPAMCITVLCKVLKVGHIPDAALPGIVASLKGYRTRRDCPTAVRELLNVLGPKAAAVAA